MRVWAIMPRSPTRATRRRPKRSRRARTWSARVEGSAVLPANACTAMGQPSGLHSRP